MKQKTSTSHSVQIVPFLDKFSVIQNHLTDISEREDIDDGFYICDLGDVLDKYLRWNKCFPRVHPHYAIKCNPDPNMLKLLVALGAGFDCASKVEIRQMILHGAQPEQIIFAHPCKQSSHVRFARDNDVKLLVFDNEEELLKLKKTFPEAHLVLRIQTDDSASVCRLSMKYGASIESCHSLIDKAFEMGLNVVGVSFHVGSGCQDPSSFAKALKNARFLFDYAKAVGYHFTLLDIGGGFPGNDNVSVKFEEITAVVNEQLELLFPVSTFPDVRVIAEPGRFFATSSFTLVTNVMAKRKVIENDHESEKTGRELISAFSDKYEETAFMYYINDGLYGAFNCLFYDHAVVSPKLLKPRSSAERKYPSSIWGPTCDGLDKIMDKIILPELDVLEWIVWEDMGAYTITASSSFNGFKVTNVRYVISEKHFSLLQDNIDDLSWDGLDFIDDCNSKDELCDKGARKLALLSSCNHAAESEASLENPC